MGSRAARRLLDAGYEVMAWNRSAPRKRRPMIAKGLLTPAITLVLTVIS